MTVGITEPNIEENYYGWRPDHLVHLSVGALIINEQGLILTIYLERVDAKYLLPTRSHLPNNTLEETLAEVKRKTGWEIEVQDYLGITVGEFPVSEGSNVRKSVIWYKCRPLMEVERDAEDRDADSEIMWKTVEELRQISEEQAKISSDVDHRAALKLLEG